MAAEMDVKDVKELKKGEMIMSSKQRLIQRNAAVRNIADFTEDEKRDEYYGALDSAKRELDKCIAACTRFKEQIEKAQYAEPDEELATQLIIACHNGGDFFDVFSSTHNIQSDVTYALEVLQGHAVFVSNLEKGK